MRADETTSEGASWQTSMFVLYNLMSSNYVGEIACNGQLRAERQRKSLADRFVVVVQ